MSLAERMSLKPGLEGFNASKLKDKRLKLYKNNPVGH